MRIKFRTNTAGRGLGSLLLGGLMLAIGLLWLAMVMRMFSLWHYRDTYIAAELEVVKYHYVQSMGRRSSSRQPNQIEGIIHPGGYTVYTNDRDISVSIFETPTSTVGRQPTRDEVEGKRYQVIHRPEEIPSWWVPPATLSTTIPLPKELAIHSSIMFIMIGGGVYLLRRGMRLASQKNVPPTGPGEWPLWAGGAFGFMLFCWLFFALLCTIVLPGEKLNHYGTERLPRTTREWVIGGGFLALFGMLCLGVTWLFLKAVRQRLSSR